MCDDCCVSKVLWVPPAVKALRVVTRGPRDDYEQRADRTDVCLGWWWWSRLKDRLDREDTDDRK